MPLTIALLVMTLAVARFSWFVTRDSLSQPARTLIRRRFGKDSWQDDLAGCYFCVSVWAGMAMAGAAFGLGIIHPWWWIPLVGLALSQAAILVLQVVDRL